MLAQTANPAPPAVGEKARDFTLTRIDGKKVQLTALAKSGPVVILMPRGWVGYQCPICNRQVGDFIARAKELETAGANVVLIYPGAADTVQGKAEDFVTGKTLPANFHFVTDPDLKTVNLYAWGGMRRTRPRTPRHSSSTRPA